MISVGLFKLKKRLTGSEDGGVAGAVLALFLVVILMVAAVVVAVHFGLTWNGIVTSFQKFFGVTGITRGGV